MQAQDVMTKQVVTASAESTVLEIAELMLKHRISAIPIVESDNKIVGIVSEGDLVRRAENDTAKLGSWWLSLFTGNAAQAEKFTKSHGKNAKDVMTKDVLVAQESASLREIANLLEKNRFKRLPIVRDGNLVGIVSRANLIQAIIANQNSEGLQSNKSDTEIRAAIISTLRQEPWSDTKHTNIIVKDGVAHLWGTVTSETQARALLSAVASTAGVKDVVNNITVAHVLYSAIGA